MVSNHMLLSKVYFPKSIKRTIQETFQFFFLSSVKYINNTDVSTPNARKFSFLDN